LGVSWALIRATAAFIAALTALVALSLFFAIIYPGDYRHQALWLVFLLTMYWITRAEGAEEIGVSFPVRFNFLRDPTIAVGTALMVLLVAL